MITFPSLSFQLIQRSQNIKDTVFGNKKGYLLLACQLDGLPNSASPGLHESIFDSCLTLLLNTTVVTTPEVLLGKISLFL